MREVASRLNDPNAASAAGSAPGTPGPAAGSSPSPARPAEASEAELRVLGIPLLAESADPDRDVPASPALRDRLFVDRRLVAGHAPESLFAYEVSAAAMKHLRGLAAPGDHVVLRRGDDVSSDRICAVRTGRGIVLSRVLFKDRSLLLLPGERERDFEALEVEDEHALAQLVAGTHVLLIRR